LLESTFPMFVGEIKVITWAGKSDEGEVEDIDSEAEKAWKFKDVPAGSTLPRCQFQQHYAHEFFVKMSFRQLFLRTCN